MDAEVVYSGILSQEDLIALLEKCTFLRKGATFLGERLPLQIVSPSEREEMVRCVPFTEKLSYTTYAEYTFGRIFHLDFELRWQQDAGPIQVTYIGIEHEIPFLHKVHNLKIEKLPGQQHYYLFGERVSGDQIEKVGKVAGDDSFAEARIPRLLHYPVQGKGRYVQLFVQEYIDTETKQVALQRFVRVKGAL